MELSIIKGPKLVVALDIGSTYSGYAWQWRDNFENNRSNIEFNTNWGTGALQLHKTTTCLLIDKKTLKVDSFGHRAETRFCKECDTHGDKVRDKWYFFKRFKLMLYGEKFKGTELAEDFNSQHLPIEEVMSKMIGALKEHFLKNLEEKGQTVNHEQTLWVVTVPAIWSNTAKKFMREAAEKSGIDKRHLLLALEPECAALYCMHLPSEQRVAMNNLGDKGDKFLTVDLGGGTLDILAVEVLHDGNLKEICQGTGDRVGGQDVNNAFFQSCKDVIKGDLWHNIGAKNVEELLILEQDFENAKVQIGSGDAIDEQIKLPIPYSVMEMVKDGKIEINTEDEKSKYFNVDKASISYNSDLVRVILFEETVKMVLSTLNKMLENKAISSVKKLVLVGGFAESKIVVEKIRSHICDRYPDIKIVVPTSPFRAVLTGAVLYGHDPLIFQSRVSKATFGVATNQRFDPTRHSEDKRWTHDEDGKYYCKDIFSVHVKKNQSVKLEQKQPSWTYNPMYERQTKMALKIYSSPQSDPKYTTDTGCRRIGKIDVNLRDTPGGRDRKVKVEMIYGGTELSVIATDVATQKEYPAEIKFDSF